MTTTPDALPERVRARVIAYAADALAALPPEQVPGPLKRVARFTPQRRARIAGQQILEQLAADEIFRDRVGIQAKARQGDVGDLLAEGTTTVDTAALAFLVRPEGWEAVVATVAAEEEAAANAPQAVGDDAESLRRQLDAALADQAEIRRSAKDQLAAAKAEVADLRRKLGDARNQARNARNDAERVEAESIERLAQVEAERATAEADTRRLKAQIAGLEAELARAQRAVRSTKEQGTVRARLLLDTLLQAGQGLRQELALPVVGGAPADEVEARLAESGESTSSGVASLPLDDPALVRELLALPRMHLVVDGYNVTRAEWDESTLESQRNRLLAGLGPVAARSGAEITVVFDGTNAETRPVVRQPRGVRVLFSPRGVLADDVIRDLVAAEPTGRPVGVVTSDQEIVRDVVRKAGVRVIASRALVRLLG